MEPDRGLLPEANQMQGDCVCVFVCVSERARESETHMKCMIP